MMPIINPAPNLTVLFTQTNTVTYANSTALTNLLGTGLGSTTIPANTLNPGSQIRVKGRGIFSTALSGPSLVVTLKLGSVTLATATVSSLIGSASNLGFSF